MMKRSLILLMAAVLCLLAGCSFGNFYHTYDHASRYTRGGGAVDGRVKSLEINWTAGSVNIQYYDGDEVLLEEDSSRPLNRNTSLYYWLDGSTLRVQYAKSGFHFSLLPWRRNPAKDLTVLLPEGTALEALSVYAVSADVWAEELFADEAEIDTVSGDVDLANVRFAETEVGTVSGNIQAALLGRSRSVKLNTVSGDISVGAQTADSVRINTTSGRVELAAESAPDSFSADTVSGSVHLYLPENDGYTIRLSSTSGNFHSDLPFRADGDRYTYGSGANRYNVDTVSGSLFFEPLAEISDWYY